MKTGIKLITDERNRQIEVEGFDEDHDDDPFHNSGELALAAICYAAPVRIYSRFPDPLNSDNLYFADPWPEDWATNWDKRKRNKNDLLIPEKRTVKETIQDLTKAGALIAAEIDRLLRLDKSAISG